MCDVGLKLFHALSLHKANKSASRIVCLEQLANITKGWQSLQMKYRIKEHRKRRGWTLEQLADVVGTSKGYLSQIESGKRTGGVDMLRSIAQALKVPEAEIFAADSDSDQQMLDHISIYQQLSDEDQAAVDRIALGLLAAKKAGGQ